MTAVAPARSANFGLDQADIDQRWGEIVDALTRREFLGGALTAGALGVLGAGGLGGPAGAAGATRLIQTTRGTVRIPARPTRVVTVDWYSLPDLLDVGFVPIGVPAELDDGLLPQYQARYARLTKVGSPAELKLETIAALRPDLIIGLDQFNDSVYAQLSQVAPTALFHWSGSGDWTDLCASVSDAVGHAATERTLKAQYTARAAAVRGAHASALAKTKIAIATGGTNGNQAVAYLWHANSDTGQVLRAAGVRLAKASASATDGGVTGTSFERLDTLRDADVIVVAGNGQGGIDSYSRPLVTAPTFKALPAAKAGHVYALDQIFPTSYRQAIALVNELDALLTKLSRAAA